MNQCKALNFQIIEEEPVNAKLNFQGEIIQGSKGIEYETDPTVPAWAKEPVKPSYTADEVGAVPTTRKIADIDLADDIDAEELADALNSHIKVDGYVPTTRKIAGIPLTNDISSLSLGEAIGISRIRYLSSAPTNRTYGAIHEIVAYPVGSQFSVRKIGLSICLDCYSHMGNYWVADWRELGYVPLSRKIAGIELKEDISAEDLANALKDHLEVSGDIDLDGYVPTTRKIADKELSADITTKELSNALGFEVVAFSSVDELYDYDFKEGIYYLILTTQHSNDELNNILEQPVSIGLLTTGGSVLWVYTCKNFNYIHTFDLKNRLHGVQGGFDSYLNPDSPNAVQNSVVYREINTTRLAVDRKIDKSTIVKSVDENSTDEQVPSAKLFYDTVGCVRKIFDEEITETTTGKYGEIVAHCPHDHFDSLYFCNRVNYNDGVNKTYEWHKIYSAKVVDNLVGDIETALDNIIAIQENLIGGATE